MAKLRLDFDAQQAQRALVPTGASLLRGLAPAPAATDLAARVKSPPPANLAVHDRARALGNGWRGIARTRAINRRINTQVPARRRRNQFLN
jgi:hypothetical protein